MAKVKITGHASGSGVITVTAPNSSTDRTLTMSDATGTLLTTNGDGSNLTGISSTLSGLSTVTVSTAKPTISINPSATGHLWIDKTRGEMYICNDKSSGANVWFNVGRGSGNIS